MRRPKGISGQERIRIARAVRKSRNERSVAQRRHVKEQANIEGMDKLVRELGDWHKLEGQ